MMKLKITEAFLLVLVTASFLALPVSGYTGTSNCTAATVDDSRVDPSASVTWIVGPIYNGSSSNPVGNGWGMSFDGTDDYVSVPDSSSLDSVDGAHENAITVCFWAKPEPLLGREDWSTRTKWWFIKQGTGKLGGAIIGTGTGLNSYHDSSYTVNAGEWNFVAMTWDGAVMRIYVNDNPYDEFEVNGTMDATDDSLYIGDRTVHDFPTNGSIDEIRVYNRSLGPGEIEYSYRYKVPLNQTGMVLWLDFDQQTQDQSGNGNNGAVNGDPAYVRGVRGKTALTFDGTDDYVTVADDASLDAAVCVDAWVYISANRPDTGVDAHIIATKDASYKGGISVWQLAGDDRLYSLYTNGTAISFAYYNIPAYGAWYHVVAQINTTTDRAELYVNGAPEGTGDAVPNLTVNNGYPFRVAGGVASRYFNDTVDELRVYNRALTATEVKEHYQRRYSNDTGLVLNLDYTSVNVSDGTWYDKSGQGNDGTIHGATVQQGSVSDQRVRPIWDQIEIVSVAFDDNRVNVGGSVEVRYVLRYDYDDVSFTGSDGSVAGFSWDAGNSWWDKSVTAPVSPGAELYDENDLGAITDNNYGLTATEDDAGANLIGDRIEILTFAANTTTPGKGDKVLLYATAELEYDHHTLSSGDSLSLESLSFTWNAGTSRWEKVVSSDIDESRTYDEFTSGNETTYVITVGNIAGLSVTVNWGHAPTITSVTITDLDDTDNCYAMRKYYAFQVVISDPDGATDIDKVYLQGKQGAATRFEVRVTNLGSTPTTFTTQSGASVIDLDTGTSTWGEAGDTGTATFKIRFEWDYTQENDLELSVYAEDIDSNSAGFTVMQTDYFDVITRLVTTGLAPDSEYVGIGTEVTISGSVRYSTTIDGNVESSKYPPDSQFTAVHIHNTTHASVGSNSTVTDGVFSIKFIIPNIIQTNEYHVYLDLVANYTDADAPDGDIVTVYGISADLFFSFDDETGNVAYDTSVSDNDGIIVGATRTGYGKYGRALTFDGVNDYINVTDHNSLDFTSQVTISAWIKTDDADYQAVVSKEDAYGLYITSNYAVRMTINSTSVDTAPNIFSPGEWTMITGVYDGANIKIYVNGVLNTTEAVTGAISTNANHLFVGRGTSNTFFNGTIDEIHVYSYDLTPAMISGLVTTPLASFPYNLLGIIYDMEATDWVFAKETYEYQGIYVRQNASYPLTDVRMRFTDGVSWTTMIYDVTSDTGDLSSVVANLLVTVDSTDGNTLNVTWEIYLSENIFDYLDVDLSMYCIDNTSRSDGWEVVEPDYFNIYNHGGMAQYESAGDGISVAGEGVFGLAVQNSSLPGGSWAYANVTWRKLQHVSMLFHWWQGTGWDAGANHWNCPSEHADTGYVEYGINYWHDGSWIDGWKVHISIINGSAGTYGVSTDQAWVHLNATWYNRGVRVKSDTFYAYYEAIESTDTSTQFALRVDLWIGIEGGSSTVGGRVSPEYFGMQEAGWGPWADWRPMKGLEDKSAFMDDLLDVGGYVISAEELEMFTAWALINKTSPDAGAPTCDSHQWGLIDYEVLSWRTLSPSEVMRGISTPIIIPAVTPGDVSTGLFANLITSMIEGITKPIVAAIRSGSETLYFAVAAVIDQAFAYFGIVGFVSAITVAVKTWGAYFLTSVTTATNFIVQILTIVTFLSGSILAWLTRFVNFFFGVNGLFATVASILNGTNTVIGGLVNVWELMSINTWIDAVPIFVTIAWFDSIDKRAKRLGGGWMAIFIGDLQMISWVVSYMLDMSFRVINFVLDMVFRMINAIKP
ncbi:MAG: LamG-like jellyroll fold domain-containing protein [Candidatus Thorarchaeota archaeon]